MLPKKIFKRLKVEKKIATLQMNDQVKKYITAN